MKTQEYFCCGYVSLQGNKKGIAYLPMVDGKVDEKAEELVFGVSKNCDYPVGWIISIEDRGKGKYGEFKYVNSQSHNDEDLELSKKYRVRSVGQVKMIDLENMRKRSKSISGTIEGMTIAELKLYANKSPTTKRMVKYYLMELF